MQLLEQLPFNYTCVCVCTGSPDSCEHSTRWRWRASSAANSAAFLATTVTAAGTEGGKLHLNKSIICMISEYALAVLLFFSYH